MSKRIEFVQMEICLSGSPSVGNTYQDRVYRVKREPGRAERLAKALTRLAFRREYFGFGASDCSEYLVA